MRTLILLAALGAAALPVAGGRAAQESPPVTVPLAFRPFESPREMMDLTWGGTEFPLEARGTAFRAFTVPPSAGKPLCFRLRLPWMRGQLVGAAGRSGPEAPVPDRIWLDWNGDRQFAADEEYAAEGEGSLLLFSPANARQEPHEKRTRFRLLLHGGDHIHAVPAGLYEGEATLDGRMVRVGLVDRNQDLACAFKTAGTEDLLLLDLNGDGMFQGDAEGGMTHPWDLEAVPLRRLVQTPGGSFYRVLPASDGNSLSLEADTRPLGRLGSATPLFALELESGRQTVWVRGREGETSLPAANYDVNWATVGVPDAAGQVWSAAVLPPEDGEEGAGQLKVGPDALLELPYGPPFRLHLDAVGRGRTRTFRVRLTDGHGNSVADVYGPDGRRPAPAEVRIEDPKGNTLAVGKSAYGQEFACSHTWKGAWGGPSRIVARAEWPLGPFAAPPVERSLTLTSGSRRYRRR